MTFAPATLLYVAHLARLRLSEQEIERMAKDLSGIFKWIEQLNEVDVTEVPPMVSVLKAELKMRPDVVTEGESNATIVENAPLSEDHFFVVRSIL